MKIDNLLGTGYKMLIGASAGYVTYKLMDKPTTDLVLDKNESVLGAFIIGVGQMAITIAVACIVGEVVTKKL